MTETGAARMLKTADFIEKVPPENFDMAVWCGKDGLEWRVTDKDIERLVAGKPACGTKACVAGWLPTFFPEEWQWAETALGSFWPRLISHSDLDRTSHSLEAFFEISSFDAYRIFDGQYSAASNAQMAAVLREYVRSQGFDSESLARS